MINIPQIDLTHFHIEYIIVLMAGIILYLLYYVFSKDASYTKNIRSVATVAEELNRELFYLKKKLNETQKSITENSQRMNDSEIYEEIERSVYDMMNPLTQSMQQLQENINLIESEISTRVSHIESGVKQISIPSSVHGNDDSKIISLFKQSVSIETISKELHISKPEVEFVLKINQLK
jgi:predicted  nucleic acid-binding Zn-ribbon protein